MAIIFAVPFVAMGLGEWGRVFNSLPNAWFRVGRVSLDGDTLKIRSFNDEKKRPTKFEHKDGDPGFLATLTRAKAAKK